MKANCVVCGAEFVRRVPWQKACGAECSAKYDRQEKRRYHAANSVEVNEKRRHRYRAVRSIEKALCVVCGGDFEKRTRAKTCGKACRAEHEREQRQRYYVAHREEKLQYWRRLIIVAPEKVREYREKAQYRRAAAYFGLDPLLYTAVKIADACSTREGT